MVSLFLNIGWIPYQNACIAMLKHDEHRSTISFKLVLVAGSEVEMKNFTNPGLACFEGLAKLQPYLPVPLRSIHIRQRNVGVPVNRQAIQVQQL